MSGLLLAACQRLQSAGSLVGFVTLLGITIRDWIILYRINTLDRGPRPGWNTDTAVRGAQERSPSILMTALVTAPVMLSISVGRDNPAREIMWLMAAIIIGGLASSTLLNLLILSELMLNFGRFDRA